jgi:leucyl aminopeptidase
MNLKISLKKGDSTTRFKTLVTFVARADKDVEPALSHLDKDVLPMVTSAIADRTFSGEKKETLLFRHTKAARAENILVVGLGAQKDFNPEAARSAAGTVISALRGSKCVESVGLDLEGFVKLTKDASACVQALVEGLLLGAYTFDEYKTAPKKKTDKTLSELVLAAGAKSSNAAIEKAVDTAEILAESVNFARRVADHPANMMTPDDLAKATVAAAKGIANLKVTVWDKARIKKERMGGLYGVSLGSDKDPRFIVMEYNGGGAKKKPVCFVGKGLTFDSGGISIKPSAQMEEMIYDMCGGANVIGTLLAIAKLKLKVNAIGLVPSTENMPGPGANKPGDILTARNGKTVEVFNTDAEGRLILMDALSYASELKPAAIFDAATLTGAILVALSNIHTGVFTRETETMTEIQKAADASGELVWQMPIHDFHLEDMKGTHADLCNISSGKGAGSSTAAAFLGEFVDRDIPWAHFDIAGTAWHTSNRLTYVPKKGATGAIIRTFVELAKAYG